MWTHKTLKKLVLETATLFQCPQLFYRPFNISLLFLTFFRYLKAKALKETIKLPWGTGTSLKNRFSKTVKNSKKAKHSSVDACITHCPKPARFNNSQQKVLSVQQNFHTVKTPEFRGWWNHRP